MTKPDTGKIVVANIEDGYAHAEPCNHAWRLKDDDTVRMYDPCPVCAEIKAAENKRVEWVYNRIVHPEASITLGLSPTKLVEIRDYIRQAYQEHLPNG